MHLGPRPALDTDGKSIQEVFVVDTANGAASHLQWASSQVGTTFCGLTSHRMSQTWFELSGCKKCVRVAHAEGVARITDVDGELIDL